MVIIDIMMTNTKRTMNKRIRIHLIQLIPAHQQEIRRMARDDDVSPLVSAHCPGLRQPIVELTGTGSYAMVDGFHRLAGMVLAGETRFFVTVRGRRGA